MTTKVDKPKVNSKVDEQKVDTSQDKKLDIKKLYEKYEQEARDTVKSNNPWTSEGIRTDVDEIFEQLTKDEMILSVVHKLLKGMHPEYDVKKFTYTVVRSAVMYGKKFELSKDKDSNMTSIRRIPEQKHEVPNPDVEK